MAKGFNRKFLLVICKNQRRREGAGADGREVSLTFVATKYIGSQKFGQTFKKDNTADCNTKRGSQFVLQQIG